MAVLFAIPAKAQQTDKPFTYIGDGKWETTTEWVTIINIMLEDYETLVGDKIDMQDQIETLMKELKLANTQLDNHKKRAALYNQQLQMKDELIGDLLRPKVIKEDVPFMTFDNIGLNAGVETDWKEPVTFESLNKFISADVGVIFARKLRVRLEQKLPINTELKIGVIF